MREILFRCKRVDNGEWIQGSLISTDGDRKFILQSRTKAYVPKNTNVLCSCFCYEVDPETVCQYTGLTDKNGKKIFEGDILDFVNEYHGMNRRWKCLVEFCEGAFVCRYIEEDGLGEYNHFTVWSEYVKWEVVGNIHDNPDLLTTSSTDSD